MLLPVVVLCTAGIGLRVRGKAPAQIFCTLAIAIAPSALYSYYLLFTSLFHPRKLFLLTHSPVIGKRSLHGFVNRNHSQWCSETGASEAALIILQYSVTDRQVQIFYSTRGRWGVSKRSKLSCDCTSDVQEAASSNSPECAARVPCRVNGGSDSTLANMSRAVVVLLLWRMFLIAVFSPLQHQTR